VKQIGTDVWQVEGNPMRLPGGVHMPLNTTVLRLADRSLLLYSPIKLDDEQAAAINAVGEVRHIVAPNLFHHLYVKAAHERWPSATIHAAPGLKLKRSDLAITHDLGVAPIDSSIDVEVVGGAPKINEAILFHRPSGAMLVADFMFNVTDPANLRTRFALSMMGVGGCELKQSRMWGFLTKDKAAARASIDRVLGWPIATIVPVHGEPVAITPAALAPKLTRAYKGPVATAQPA
jgi:hypothetical protein